ncbi:putative colanic acid biosynthesis acetyltransferase [Granulicella cerasi]|uniref:Colanic acid biosynthesis acetyltransferase n=1 Tax=Granulicella cerasi TaxID=741063 RepID=A0ABW1Z6G8_9BACT|nr:putative colanic acid biosynthesis acetyltransferase [Granulicella cerasi]
MPRQSDYNTAEHMPQTEDAYTQAAFPLSNRLRRLVWNIVWLLLFRLSPRPFHAWRAMLLRLFGATLGPDCHFYPACKVWAPWNLVCADHVAAGDGVELYNPSPMHLGSHAIISQSAYICGATHDYNDPRFPLQSFRMEIGAYAWICARASVLPGVKVGEGAVLGLGSIASKNLEPWTVYSGNPAQAVRERVRVTDVPA